jgi:hypothetical protein
VQSPGLAPERALVSRPILRGVGALVLAASLAAGGIAFVRDLTLAYRWAGPSVIPATVRTQLDTLRNRLPKGSTVLLVVSRAGDVSWYVRLFQRALYPTDVVVVRSVPLPNEAELRAMCRRHGIRYAISMGAPPADPGYLAHEDLGSLPAIDDRVWFGRLVP